ncbi:MAG: citrate lyase subunit alpha [Spirochaetae bacterium HGW-Spirochaetae-3]|jgi:citrate lyase subunit alpha/citrate CoA-transferase|nr:MAG: citrate lyase subunit alpha [Spirochaetae bacterium HGW-Spirochaetae-3]
MIVNAVGRAVPAPEGGSAGVFSRASERAGSKVYDSLERALDAVGVESGMTVSFHHHFREGDLVVNAVVDALARRGVRDLVLAPSSLTTAHAPLIDRVKDGTIRSIRTSGLRGPLADAISAGLMDEPVLIHSHGGRARAIDSGEIKVDMAFLGVPACDERGNANGTAGRSACGSLGYAMVDARNAAKVVLLTEEILPYPLGPASIRQDQVDAIVRVDSVGDPAGIGKGATRMTRDPRELLIASSAARAIRAAGVVREGYSLQTGSGGASLAVVRFLREAMLELGVKASFALGGITSQLVRLHEEGLVGALLDTQSFDLDAARSLAANPGHREIDASYYANPARKGCAVDALDVVVLSAMEVDLDLNVNVITGSDGVIRGASGGHCDTAAGAALTVVVTPLIRGRIPSILDRVTTVVTPGESVDLLVTDRGIAVNPRRPELRETLEKAGLPIREVAWLKRLAESYTGAPRPVEFDDRIVGLVEYRDGTIIDAIRRPRASAL